MLRLLRRVLNFKVSIEAMIEVAMWLAIPYLTVGVGLTFFHPDLVRQIGSQLQKSLPAGADLLAFGLTTVLWPVLLFTSDICAA